MTRKRFVAVSLVLLGALLASGLVGCNPFKPKTQVETDVGGSFHFYMPATWLHKQTTGLLAVYASDKLPTTESAANSSIESAPSFLVLTSNVPSSAPVPTELTRLVMMRAQARGWKQAHLSDPTSVQIGDRKGSRVTVTGTDSTGVSFSGAFYLVRTGGKEFFLAALAAPDKWDAFSKQLDTVFKQWYWTIPATTSNPPKK